MLNSYATNTTPLPGSGSSLIDTSDKPTAVSDTMVDHTQKARYPLLAMVLSKPQNKGAIKLIKKGYPIILRDVIVLGYEDVLKAMLSLDRVPSVSVLVYFLIVLFSLFFDGPVSLS